MTMQSAEGYWTPEPANLIFTEHKLGRLDVHYAPLQTTIDEQLSSFPDNIVEPVNIVSIDCRSKRLKIYPIFTRSGKLNYLCQRYDKIVSISFATRDIDDLITSHEYGSFTEDDLDPYLQNLPSNFYKNWRYGLGLKSQFEPMIKAVGSLSDAIEICISDFDATKFDEHTNTFYISSEDNETIRRYIDTIIGNNRKALHAVRDAETYNFFADRLDEPRVPINEGRSELRRIFTGAALTGSLPLSELQQTALVGTVAQNLKEIIDHKPEEVAVLRQDIELATLARLIEYVENNFNEHHDEDFWHDFLNTNRFILSLVFGFPVTVIRDKVSLGGHTLNGDGNTITDFVARNMLSNNSALIEIKTPDTKITGTSYRKQLYSPSWELAGAVNQMIDQKYEHERNVAQMLVNSEIDPKELLTYAVQCCLIAGRMPADEPKKKSFEMFRSNSKHVSIVTFDELLLKMNELKNFLDGNVTEAVD